jgi:hypothetical protein
MLFCRRRRPIGAWNPARPVLLAGQSRRRKGGFLRKAMFLIGVAAVTACAPAPPPAPVPAPVRVAPPAPAPPSAPVAQDWRDLPLSPGDWGYEGGAGGSRAAFGGGLFALRCDPASKQVELSRIASGAATMILTTSFGARRLPLSPTGTAAIPAGDALLDQIAFSRGRFTVEVDGLDRLVIPAWPEPARVVEDCRS